jgi:ketosteroid isomerase-like protein
VSPARSDALERVVGFYESISPGDIGRLADIYAADASFKDPFNEVRGVAAIARIFEHMFEQVDAPRFAVRDTVEQPGAALVVWDFDFAFRRPLPGGPRTIRGCSHLRFDDTGRVTMHRDYWDAAEELYEKLPVIGGAMRWLRRRGAVPPGP